MKYDIKELLKKVIEVIMPDLDHYRKPLRKGRVIATYPAGSSYLCDIELLLNNEEPDESEPIVKGVDIPVIWGGSSRGIICPPAVGTCCDVEYYHGDTNYPRISNFRWHGGEIPVADVNELIIQQKNGVHIHIKANSDIEINSTSNININVDGNATIIAGGTVSVKAGAGVSIDGGSGELSGVVTHNCICPITGAPHIEYSRDVTASK